MPVGAGRCWCPWVLGLSHKLAFGPWRGMEESLRIQLSWLLLRCSLAWGPSAPEKPLLSGSL